MRRVLVALLVAAATSFGGPAASAGDVVCHHDQTGTSFCVQCALSDGANPANAHDCPPYVGPVIHCVFNPPCLADVRL